MNASRPGGSSSSGVDIAASEISRPMLGCSGTLVAEYLLNKEAFHNQSPRSTISVVGRAASFGATMDSLMKVVPSRSSVDARHRIVPKISRH